MAEGKCAVCAKWLLVIFNIIFCFIGVGLIICGTYAYIQLKDYLDFFGDVNINAPAIVLIAFGCFTFVIAAIGCVGAFRENPCLLFVFGSVIGVLLVAEMASGAVAFVFRAELKDFVKENADIMMQFYNESKEDAARDAWDVMHKKLECCGVNGPKDWLNTTIASRQNGKVPNSCRNYTSGCVDNFVTYAYSNVLLIGAAGIAFATIEIVGIVLSCILGCAARKNEVS